MVLKKKNKNKGTDLPTFTQPEPCTWSGLSDTHLPCKVGEQLACSSTGEKEWCIRERAQDLRQLQPNEPNEPNERAELEAAVTGKLKINWRKFNGFKTKGGPASLEHRLGLPSGFQLSFNQASLGFAFVFKMIYFYCMCLCVCLHVFKCAVCMTSTESSRHQIPRTGVTGKVMSHHVSAGNWIQVLLKSSKWAELWSHLSCPSRACLDGESQRAWSP